MLSFSSVSAGRIAQSVCLVLLFLQGGVLADQDCNGRTRGKGIKISGCNAAIAVPSNSVPKGSNGMATRGQYKIAGFLIVAVLVLAPIPF